MKIRSGFVSNSSSSSYIITINISPAKFYKLLYDEYHGWCIDELAEKIATHIAIDKNNLLKTKRQQEQKFEDKSWLLETIENIKSKITRLETIYKTVIADEDAESVISAIMEYTYITLEKKEDRIRLTGLTTMHNCFADMPEVLREILLFFLFDTSFKVECFRKGQYDEVVKTQYVEEF